MNFLLLVLGSVLIAHVCLATSANDLQQERITRVLEKAYGNSEQDVTHEESLSQFREFVKEFGRKYDSDTELKYRFDAFKRNMKLQDHFVKNEKGTAEYGITQFSDMTEKELRRMTSYCDNLPELNTQDMDLLQDMVERGNEVLYEELAYKSVPKSVDWREKGFVSRVLDQGYCAAAWAYAATSALETAYAIETNKFQKLSKQQLIDCDPYNGGCCGGKPHTAFLYIAKENGLELDKTYNGRKFLTRCHYKRENGKAKVYGLTMFTNTSIGYNEQLMEKHVAEKGPVVVEISPRGLPYYKNGILKQADAKCYKGSDYISHAVTLVGFGEENGIKYWIVKNSWGEKWGEKGFFRIQRGLNMCGLAYYGVAPIVTPPKRNAKYGA